MKPLINKLSNHAGLIFFPVLFIWKKKRGRLFFLFFAFTLLLTGCFNHFFRTGTLKGADAATIQRLQSAEKYFILHVNDSAMAMNNVKVQKDKISADLSVLPPGHLHYLTPKAEKPNVIKVKDKPAVLAEVHLYYTRNIDTTQSHFSADLSEFSRVDVYEFDPKTTTFNHVMSAVGIVVGVATVIGIISLIAVAIACNCPQVYVDNGQNYEFVSGVYSGSIYASMERSDYLPLPTIQQGNEFNLKVANVKNENQYINSFQLMEVNHHPGVKVLVDRHGKVFTYVNPRAPETAFINDIADIKKLINDNDNTSYNFDSEKNENGLSSLILNFRKPANATKSKLIVHGGNSLWSGYIYHRFAEMFGNKYEAWRDQKDKSDPNEMEQWQKDQSLPLMVYIERNGQWELADYFAHTGNTATRDMIMEIDMKKNMGNDVKIKLETAYQFWNLDYAAMDFSPNEPTTVSFIGASSAFLTGEIDQKDLLKEKDDSYCKLCVDESINLSFIVDNKKNNIESSYFLISTGYYHNIQKYQGPPDLKTLNSFKTKGSFDNYSRRQFSIIQESLTKASTVNPVVSNK